MTPHRANITNGPSKFDLMLALFDRERDQPRREVTFIEDSRIREAELSEQGFPPMPLENVVITGLKCADHFKNYTNMSDVWMFEGYYDGDPLNKKISGLYTCSTRQGWIDFL